MATFSKLSRDHLIKHLFFCRAMSVFEILETDLSGNRTAGRMSYCEATGDGVAALWDRKNFVMIASNHEEIGDTEDDRLKGLPSHLRASVKKIRSSLPDPYVTSGLWLQSNRIVSAQTWKAYKEDLVFWGDLSLSPAKLWMRRMDPDTTNKEKRHILETANLIHEHLLRNSELTREVLDRVYLNASGRPIHCFEATKRCANLKKLGLKVQLPKAYREGGELFVKDPIDEIRQQNNQPGVTITELVDVALKPTARGFEVRKNLNVFDEYYILKCDQNLIFISLGAKGFKYKKCFDKYGKPVTSRGVKAWIEKDPLGNRLTYLSIKRKDKTEARIPLIFHFKTCLPKDRHQALAKTKSALQRLCFPLKIV